MSDACVSVSKLRESGFGSVPSYDSRAPYSHGKTIKLYWSPAIGHVIQSNPLESRHRTCSTIKPDWSPANGLNPCGKPRVPPSDTKFDSCGWRDLRDAENLLKLAGTITFLFSSFENKTSKFYTVGHESHDPCFHKKYTEAGVMTFVAHCTKTHNYCSITKSPYSTYDTYTKNDLPKQHPQQISFPLKNIKN